MAIVQISRILQRSGNLVDLPQLAEAELGFATDAKLLFIGKTLPNENVEVLTSYSTISFGQIDGSYGNINITAVQNGQVLTYDSTSNVWVNAGGNASNPGNTALYSSTPIHLGDANTLHIGGGAIGYVLETDGSGNLNWTPKGTLYSNILALSNANPIVMTVDPTTPYTNNAEITISGVDGSSNNIVNGQTVYVQLSGDYPTSGNVKLYASPGTGSPIDGTGLTYTNSPNAIATCIISSGSGAAVGGSTYSIIYNNSGIGTGDSNLTYNFTTNLLTLNGTANVGNLNATSVINGSQLISTITTGTSPLLVTSTTRIANANVETAGNLVNGTSNVIVTNNGNVNMSVAGTPNVMVVSNTGANISGVLNVSSTTTLNGITSNASPAFTAGTAATSGISLQMSDNSSIRNYGLNTIIYYDAGVGATSSGGTHAFRGSNVYTNYATISKLGMTTNGNLIIGGSSTSQKLEVVGTAGNIQIDQTGDQIAYTRDGYNYLTAAAANATIQIQASGASGKLTFATANVERLRITNTGVITASGNANVGNIGATNAVLAGSITGITTLSASGNANVGNIGSKNAVLAGSITGITTLSASGNANVGNIGATNAVLVGSITGITTLSASGNATVGNISATNIIGTLTTANQPNVTNVGTLTSLSVTGNVNSGNLLISSSYLSSQPTFRNRIINGNFLINQRGNVNINTTGVYGPDRWIGAISGGSGVSGTFYNAILTGAQNAAYISSSFTNGVPYFSQRIESVNTGDLNSSNITVSGLLYQNTGSSMTFSIRLVKPNSMNDYSSVTYLSTVTTSSITNNTIVPFTATFSLGANDATYGLALEIFGTAPITVTSKDFAIGNVQLEKGSVATPFELRSYGIELTLCQRYFTTTVNSVSYPLPNMRTITSANYGGTVPMTMPFPVTMRTSPTLTIYPTNANRNDPGNALINNSTTSSLIIATTSNQSLIHYNNGALINVGEYYVFYYDANAEL